MPAHSNVAKDVLDEIFEAAAPKPPSDLGDLPPPIAPEPDNTLEPLNDLFAGNDPGQDYHPVAEDITTPIWGDTPPQLPDPPSFDDHPGNDFL